MRTLRFLSVALIISALMTISAFAQTATSQPPAPTKFAVIYTEAFGDSKNGITKYIAGLTTLKKEFEQSDLEIKTLGTRYENLYKEIEGLQSQYKKTSSPVIAASMQPKIDEYAKLGRELQFKQEDFKSKYQRRASVIINPILDDIGNAIQAYTAQKGFDVIFDANKLKESGLVIGMRDEKVDVTTDFIAFYNARPNTAPTTTPK